MKCPWCKQEINNPEPLRHMIDCQKQEEALWNSRFQTSLAEMRVKHLEEQQA